MSTDSRPAPIWTRVVALALAALLLLSAHPSSTAAAQPEALPPRYEVKPLPQGDPPRNVPGTENQIIVYNAGTGTTELFPLPAAIDMPDAASVPGRFDPLATALLPEDFGSLSLVGGDEVQHVGVGDSVGRDVAAVSQQALENHGEGAVLDEDQRHCTAGSQAGLLEVVHPGVEVAAPGVHPFVGR